MGTDHQFVRDQDILFVYSGERMEPSTIKMIRDELLVKVQWASRPASRFVVVVLVYPLFRPMCVCAAEQRP